MSASASGEPPERTGTEGLPHESAAAAETRSTDATTTARPSTEIPRTWTARVFISLIAFALVLILLLVFILENTESVKISYFGDGFHMPLGVALLLAAIGGALLTGLVGAARIVQLRRHVRRRMR